MGLIAYVKLIFSLPWENVCHVQNEEIPRPAAKYQLRKMSKVRRGSGIGLDHLQSLHLDTLVTLPSMLCDCSEVTRKLEAG